MKKFGNMFLLAVCAGLSIAILFTVGLYTIVLNGLFLYTGKIGYFATTKEKKPYLILLLATWTGNLVGTGLGALYVDLNTVSLICFTSALQVHGL